MRRLNVIITVMAVVIFAQGLLAQQGATMIRDQWGVPHVYGVPADAGFLSEQMAFHGAGYAEAENRLLQMLLARASVQGRLSEFFGQAYLDHDRRLRTVGLYRHAQECVSMLPDTVRMWLEAYAAGVNQYMAIHRNHLSDEMNSIGLIPEPWTAADAIACWFRIAEYFDRGWTKEVQALRKFETMLGSMTREEAILELETNANQRDDEAVIVTKAEYDRYDEEFQKLVNGIAPIGNGALRKGGTEEEWTPPKMSHNWAVSGAKSSTGLPILESDPQIAVQSPATWYESHISGGRFNVRGISMPGTPVMLLGFNEHCAWGLTALGSDNADLFQEKLKPGSRTEYEWMGRYESMTEHQEVIKVRGGRDVTLNVQSTRHGPVVNQFVNGVQAGEAFALHWLVLKESASTVEGLLRMMAARDWPEFVEGVEQYQSPGVHLIYADRKNTIAYYTMSRIPLRVHNAGIPYRGWTGDEEWQGTVPFDEMPRMLNPLQGYISTANNAPIGSWYPYVIGGGLGDNARSWRLKELMEGTAVFTPADFLDVHRDMTDPIARDFVRYAVMAVDEEQPQDADALAAADSLRSWDYTQNTAWSVYRLTSMVGVVIKRSLRGTPLESRYLGSDAGLIQLFRDLEEYEAMHGGLSPDPDIRDWLIAQLGECYRRSGIGDPGARPAVVTHSMPWQNNLENFGTLNRNWDIVSPPLTCGVVATIWSQLGNSYSQIVDLANIDSSQSILPPGNCEVPAIPHFMDMVPLWVEGGMHPAPLSLEAVERTEESRYFVWVRPAGLENPDAMPAGFSVQAPYPSPVTSHAVIAVDLRSSGSLQLSIRDLLGREVHRQYMSEAAPGRHYLTWTPVSGTPAGIYLVTILHGEVSRSIRIVYRP